MHGEVSGGTRHRSWATTTYPKQQKAAPAETSAASHQNPLTPTSADWITQMDIHRVTRTKSSRNHWWTGFVVSGGILTGMIIACSYFPAAPEPMFRLMAGLGLTSICTGALALLQA